MKHRSQTSSYLPTWKIYLLLVLGPRLSRPIYPTRDSFITHSCWGKFVGWREERLSHCRTIFYFDGYLRPRKKNWEGFQNLSAEITESKSGLAQVAHPEFNGWGVDKILNKIVRAQKDKDMATNAKASQRWLKKQSDFKSNCTSYLNKQVLWYSLELDSWRDQPLWSYSLHHFNVTPLVFTETGKILDGGDMYVSVKKKMGFQGHTYSDQSNSDALRQSSRDSTSVTLRSVEVD